MGSNLSASTAREQTLDAFIELSQALRWEQVPQATRASVRRELLDYLGAAIAGRAAAGLPRWLKVLIDMGGRPDARVIGGPRVPTTTAARDAQDRINREFGRTRYADLAGVDRLNSEIESLNAAGIAAEPACSTASSCVSSNSSTWP